MMAHVARLSVVLGSEFILFESFRKEDTIYTHKKSFIIQIDKLNLERLLAWLTFIASEEGN